MIAMSQRSVLKPSLPAPSGRVSGQGPVLADPGHGGTQPRLPR